TNIDAGSDLFSDLLATYLNVPLGDKQRLVEMLDPADRLSRLVDLVEHEVARVMVESDITLQATVDLQRKQREHLLREQMRVIQDELGESAGGRKESDEYLEDVAALPLDDGYKDTV